MSPLLTIIIPTFNSHDTLKQALDSILEQTFKDYEILFIDNKSIDGTLSIIKDSAALYENIRCISEPDNGIYDAMNKGILMARGNWIYFMGSDDRLYDINVLSKIFNNKPTIFKKIIYGNVLIEGNAGWASDNQIYDGKFTLAKLINKNICHQAIFYNKKVFKKHGKFKINYSICADWDMNLRLWSTYSFHYTDLLIAVFKGGNCSYQIANNYGEKEKWVTIINCFYLKLLSRQFSEFHQNFFLLSQYYGEKGEYIKSLLFKIIFHFHKIRLS